MENNPFRPGVGKEPLYLADRKVLLSKFKRYLNAYPDNPTNLRVNGLRGVGKSVLLRHYKEIAENQGWVCLDREVSHKLTGEKDFLLAFESDLNKIVHSLSKTAKAKDYVKGIVGTLGSLVSMSTEIEGITINLHKGTFSGKDILLEDVVKDALVAVGKLAQKVDKGVIFFYDEAQNLKDNKGNKQYPLNSLLGAFIEAQNQKLPVMLVMAGLPSLRSNLQTSRSHTERLFKVDNVNNISLDRINNMASEASKAFIEPCKKTSIKIDEKLAEKIAGDLDGYPYFIQAFGEELWDIAEANDYGEISETLYLTTKNSIQSELDISFYEGRYEDDASTAEQKILLAAASLGGESFEVGRLKESMKKNNSALSAQLANMCDNNIIYREKHGIYAYTVPKFGEFLRRKLD